MTDVSPLLAQADSLLEANRISEAKQLYAEIARLAPDNADAWLMLGLIEQEQANPAKAEAHLRRAIELDNHLAEAHLNLANLLRLQQRLDDARYHARLAVQIDDTYAEAWIFLGGLDLESKDFSSAEASFKRALGYWPDNPNLHLSVGHSQAGNRQLKDAEESFNRAVALGATSADDYSSLAKINLQLSHFTEAVQNAATALEKAPDRTEILHLLANALIADRRAAEALPILEDLVKTQPVSPDVYFSYGSAYHALKDFEQGREWYEKACIAQPDSARSHVSLAHTESQLGHYDKVIEHSRRALELQSCLDEAELLLADALQITGAFTEAASTYRSLLQRQPDNNQAIAGLIETYEKTGDIEAGRRLLADIAETRICEAPRIGLAAARLYAHIGKRTEAIHLLSTLLESVESRNDDVASNVLIGIHNQLGKLLDRNGRYREAFLQFHASNKLRPSTFIASEHVSAIDQILGNWRLEDLSGAHVSANTSSRPLFIVGMPRSGSTLAEQILSCHPLVAAGGEIQIIPQIAGQLSGETWDIPFTSPSCKRLTKLELDEASGTYLDILEGIDANARFVTDKLPYNYLHLGLISVLFPKAKIIHCKRAPLDTCISIYIQNFSGPKGFATNLDNIGTVYTQYQRLMKHWLNAITNPIFELSYEALVNNQTRTTKSLLEFCELPWDDRCLAFYSNDRTALTASYNQVRQPMYRHSIDRWKNYAAELENQSQLLQTFTALQTGLHSK